MGLQISVLPTAEPVTLAEVKAQLHLTSDNTDDDVDLLLMMAEARNFVETFLRRQLMTATYTLTMDRFPYLTVLDPLNQANPKFDNANYYYGSPDRFAIWIPRPPLQSVSSIVYLDTTSSSQTLDPTTYNVDATGEPGRIAPVYGQFWPGTVIQPNAVTVTYVAGYTSASLVPGIIKRAIKILVQQIYNGVVTAEMPESVKLFLYPYRVLDERTLEYA
jgi:hypothetical protein